MLAALCTKMQTSICQSTALLDRIKDYKQLLWIHPLNRQQIWDDGVIPRHVSWIKTSVSVGLVVHITLTQHSPPQISNTGHKHQGLYTSIPKKSCCSMYAWREQVRVDPGRYGPGCMSLRQNKAQIWRHLSRPFLPSLSSETSRSTL